MTRADWTTAFLAQLRSLGVRGEREALADMATQIHLTQGASDPCEAAQAEWDIWPIGLASERLPL